MLLPRSYRNRMFPSENMSICEDKKHENSYSVPQTKLRNVSCVYCKRNFTIQGVWLKEARLPLLLKCGHSTCEECGKQNESCPICKINVAEDKSNGSLLPLNVFTIGLTVILQNFSDHVNDPDIAFCPSIGSKLRQPQNKKLCFECGISAILQCQQCNVLLCSPCFSKIHGRALQSHKKILLSEEKEDNSLVIRNTCSFICNGPLQYYCKQCDASGCSHCMIRLHPKHDCITQKEKNEEVLPEFQEVHEQVARNLQRVLQAQKNLKKLLIFPSELQNSEAAEASINRHFLHLHGVLQNLEKKMITKLYEQRDYLNRNLEEISTQLREQEELLHAGLMLAGSVKDGIDRINLTEVIARLKDLTNAPCHLVQDIVPKDEEVKFDVDMSIIDAIEKHCKVKVPAPTGFSLLPTEKLPEDYQMEPLPEDTYIQNLLEKSLVPALKSASSTQSVDSSKSDNMVLTEGNSTGVKILYVESPSCFYVLPASSMESFKKLDNSIQLYAKRNTAVPEDIAINKLYIFQRQERKWCRGRVHKVYHDSEGKVASCKMFCIDLGNVEDNVPVSKIKSITTEHMMLPQLAKKCSLHDIVPRDGKWQNEAIQYMINLKKNKSMSSCISMYVKKEYADTYSVDLVLNSFKDGGQLSSIRDVLVYLGYGSLTSQHRLMRTNPNSVQQFYYEELELNTYVNVTCLRVESPDAIYVRKTSEHSAHFEKAMDEMMKDYQKNFHSKGRIFVPEIGLPCAAPDKTGKWRRGLIVDIPGEAVVLVLYVDMGYTAILHCESIRRLSEYYMKCRIQAIRVSLRDVRPLNESGLWDENVIELMKPCLMHKPLEVIAVEKLQDSYSVHMYLPNRANFNTLLVSSGLAYSTRSNTRQPTRRKRNKAIKNQTNMPLQICNVLNEADSATADLDENSKCSVLKKEQELEQKNTDPFKIHVRVHTVESPNSIYVSDPTSEVTNTCLMKEIQDFYKKYCSDQVDSWEKGVVCVAYSSANKCYCRARIIDIISPEEVTVFLYDLGATETVEIRNIQPLHLKFANTPAYLFRIKLAGILPCGGSTNWPSSSCRKLNEIIDNNQNCKFYISKMIPKREKPEEEESEKEEEDEDEDDDNDDVLNEAVPVELWVKQSKTDGPLLPTRIEINSVNRMLIDEGYALPNKVYNEKGEKVLAVELQRQLEKRLSPVTNHAAHIKWMPICNEIEVPSNNSSTMSIPKTFFDVSEANSEHDLESDIPLPPKMAKWIPAIPIEEDQFVAVGSYLDENCILYIHPKIGNYDMLSYIESELADFYKKVKIKPCDVEWSEGDLCIAQYHYNNKWCRGTVQKVYDDYVQVQFVDYGNVEDCMLGTVKKKVILGHIPIQCMRCIIHGLEPDTPDDKWTTKDLDKIHALLVDKEFTVYVFDRTPTHLIVTILLHDPAGGELINYLYSELKISVKMQEFLSEIATSSEQNLSVEDVVNSDNQEIIIEEYMPQHKQVSDDSNIIDDVLDDFEEDDALVSGSPTFARLKKHISDNVIEDMSSKFDDLTWTDIVSVDEDAVVTSTPQNESHEQLHTCYTPLKIPRNVMFMEIVLCCYVDFTTFFVQPEENACNAILHKCYKQYKKVMDDIQKHVHKQPKIKSIELNTPCCAQFNDGLWYRCIIARREFKSDTIAEITLRFVDFGNEEDMTLDVNNHELYALKEEWFNVPSMAIKCKLWNIEVVSSASLKLLAPKLEDLHDKSVVAKIIKHKNSYIAAEVYTNKDCKTLFYNSLIEEGFFTLKKTKED